MNTLRPRLTTFLFLCFSAYLSGQSCPDGDIYLLSQGDINNFSTNYPGCTVIEGDLIIQDYAGDQIRNLSGLAAITTIKGDLVIGYSYFLTTLDGLQALDSVYG